MNPITESIATKTLERRTQASNEHRQDADERNWSAVKRRDRSADGTFFYGVLTTGIYCNPSCASRMPRRGNVRFFASAADAERAGLRACKRCRPNEPGFHGRQVQAVEQACRLLDTAEEAPDLETLARTAGMSRFHFHRVFKSKTGLTPKAYADARRAERVRGELLQTRTVTEAIYGAGFRSNGRFYASSTERLGMTPSEYRRRGAGTRIHYAVRGCSLGSVLVAATDKGICSIQFGDRSEPLVRALEQKFPQATLAVGDDQFEALVSRAVGAVEEPSRASDLPLDVRGTAFQERVWRALQQIPAGKTVSYAELAETIGAADAVRAVARACATNPVAVVIPCHRVVRADGTLSGYRWGEDRKRALLEREREGGSGRGAAPEK